MTTIAEKLLELFDMKTGSTALVATFLTACAASPLYQEPLDKEGFSQVRIVNSSTRGLAASIYQEPLTCSDPIRFLNSEIATNESHAIYAKKGKPFTVGAHYLTGWTGSDSAGVERRVCYIYSTFVPTANNYRLTYGTNDSVQTCTILATQQESGAWKVAEPGFLKHRVFNLAFLQSGPWCKPLTAEQQASLRAP